MNFHAPIGPVQRAQHEAARAARRNVDVAAGRFVPPPSNRKTMVVTPRGYVPAPPPLEPAPRPLRPIDLIAARRRRQSEEQRAVKVVTLAAEPQIEIEYDPSQVTAREDIAVVCHPFRWEQILREVAAKHGLHLADMLSARRGVPLCLARYEAMWRMRHETNMSTPQIGRRMGGRDHTTILTGIKRHAARMKAGDV